MAGGVRVNSRPTNWACAKTYKMFLFWRSPGLALPKGLSGGVEKAARLPYGHRALESGLWSFLTSCIV